MRENNRAENSHLSIRRRERKQQKFKFQGSAQRFLSRHGPIYNTFNPRPHPISRPGLRTLRAKVKLAWAAATIAANRPRLAPSDGLKRLSCRFRCGGGTERSRTTSTQELPRSSGRHRLKAWRRLLGRRRTLPAYRLTTDGDRLLKMARFNPVRADIVIVQPGLTKAGRTNAQSPVLWSGRTLVISGGVSGGHVKTRQGLGSRPIALAERAEGVASASLFSLAINPHRAAPTDMVALGTPISPDVPAEQR